MNLVRPVLAADSNLCWLKTLYLNSVGGGQHEHHGGGCVPGAHCGGSSSTKSAPDFA